MRAPDLVASGPGSAVLSGLQLCGRARLDGPRLVLPDMKSIHPCGSTGRRRGAGACRLFAPILVGCHAKKGAWGRLSWCWRGWTALGPYVLIHASTPEGLSRARFCLLHGAWRPRLCPRWDFPLDAGRSRWQGAFHRQQTDGGCQSRMPALPMKMLFRGVNPHEISPVLARPAGRCGRAEWQDGAACVQPNIIHA